MTVELVCKSRNISNKLPLNFKEEDRPFFEGLEYSTQEVYRIELDNVNVSYAGTIFSFLKTYFHSVKPYYKYKLGYIYTLYNLFFRKRSRVNEDLGYLLVFNNLCDCYYHWLTEAIPKLFLGKNDLKNAKIILPEGYKGFQIASLEPFGINSEDVKYISSNTYLHVPHLISFSPFGAEQHYNPKLFGEVRDFYINFYKSKDDYKPVGDRLYIKRKKTSIRQIKNEQEVISFLAEYGFKDVFFEDLSFPEQVFISYNAQCLVSIHGAGLTNIMFMKSGSKILEFRKKGETGYLHYYNLASALDLDYYYQFADPVDETKSSKYADLNIDIEELRKNVIQMLN